MRISPIDIRILDVIQSNCSLSTAKLANHLNMAQSTLWRKIQELEAAGVITARVALLDPVQVGCKLTVLAAITLTDHSEATVTGFQKLIERRPEVTECFATSGTADYSMKIRVADVEAYETFMTQTLLRSSYVRELQSSFVLKELKHTTALPL